MMCAELPARDRLRTMARSADLTDNYPTFSTRVQVTDSPFRKLMRELPTQYFQNRGGNGGYQIDKPNGFYGG